MLQLKTNIRQEGDLRYGKLLDSMAVNNLSEQDMELLQQCVLKSNSGFRGLSLAMNPYIMPFVPRVFIKKDDITTYTQKVLAALGNDAKVTLSVQEEYNPKETQSYLAYGKQKVKDKVKAFITKTTKDCDTELFIGCPVRFLENKDLEAGVVNGAIGKFKGVTERGKHPIVELKNGTLYTLFRSSSSIYLDDYTTYERRAIESGRMQPYRDRPVAKFTYRHYQLKVALAMTPHALQGCNLDTAIIHPNVAYDNDYMTIECLLVSLSRLRSSGVDRSGKAETIRAMPKRWMQTEMTLCNRTGCI